nr:chaperone protein ClpB1 [Tanacetum cinerariifolium]
MVLETQLANLQEELNNVKERLNQSELWKKQAHEYTEEAKKQLAKIFRLWRCDMRIFVWKLNVNCPWKAPSNYVELCAKYSFCSISVKRGDIVGVDGFAGVRFKEADIYIKNGFLSDVGDEKDKLNRIAERLRATVIGQDEAVDEVARAVLRSRHNLGSSGRPYGSFIFLRPTGVGKTELAKALASELFGDERLITMIDMSEYKDRV